MSLRIKTLICFVAICGVVLPWPLFAAVCVQRVVKQRVVTYAQPVVAYQQVAYQQVAYASPYQYAIGSDLVLEALAEKLSARIEEKLIQRQQALQPKPQSLVAEKCSRCHSPKSKAVLEDEAPVFFSDIGELIATSEQRAAMKTASKFGAMPPAPAQPLDDDTYLGLVQELKQGPQGLRSDYPPPVNRNDPSLQEVPLPPQPNGQRRTAPPAAEEMPQPPAPTSQPGQ